MFLASICAFAQERAEKHVPMPEPLLTETVTDLDGDEPGEFEVEVNGSAMRARSGGATVLWTSVEAEWLVTRRLGFRLEPSLARELRLQEPGPPRPVGLGVGMSWKLLRDFRRDIFMQAEVNGHLPWEASRTVEPGESGLPLAFDLRAGVRVDRWTARGGLGFAVGATSPHVPLRGSVALLTSLDRVGTFGFWGVELDADGARQNPFVLAPNVVANCTPIRLPFSLGVAIPWSVGADSTKPSLGLFFRLFFLSEREVEFGSKNGL